MKLLVVGEGLLGRRCLETCREEYTAFGAYHTTPADVEVPHYKLDITSKTDVSDLFDKISPSVVIHAAAFTNVDRCETEREAAFRVNVRGTRNIALAAEKIRAKLIYVSTDYVFDGETGLYREDSLPAPVNYYGLTKLKGEEEVESVCSDYIIARTSVIYGVGRQNFATWIIDELKKGNGIRIVKDQFVSPTLNTDLAMQLLALLEHDEQGVFHTAGGERINRYDFALRLADFFSLDKDLICPVTSEELNWVAKRPRDSSLDISKVSGFKKPLIIRDALEQFKGECSK